jgi:hypothetical protein
MNTPYKIEVDAGHKLINVVDCNDFTVAQTTFVRLPYAERYGEVHGMTVACNNHEKLVALCEASLALLQNPDADEHDADAMIADIEVGLKSVKGLL